jgi:hypothetical protein
LRLNELDATQTRAWADGGAAARAGTNPVLGGLCRPKPAPGAVASSGLVPARAAENCRRNHRQKFEHHLKAIGASKRAGTPLEGVVVNRSPAFHPERFSQEITRGLVCREIRKSSVSRKSPSY